MIPQLSIEERDRRYKIVRAEMAQTRYRLLAAAGEYRSVGTAAG